MGSGSFGGAMSAAEASLPDDILGGPDDGGGLQRRGPGGALPPQQQRGGKVGRGGRGPRQQQGVPLGQHYGGAPLMRGGGGGPGRGALRGPSPGRRATILGFLRPSLRLARAGLFTSASPLGCSHRLQSSANYQHFASRRLP